MTSRTALPQDSPGSSTRSAIAPAAIITVIAATVLAAFGSFADGTDGGEHSVGEFLVVVAFILVAAGVVFGLVVPRFLDRPSAAGVGLGLSIAALVLVMAFWSGLPPVLGVGGILLGKAARDRGRGGLATAAITVGALALVADVAIYVADWMSTNNIAGM